MVKEHKAKSEHINRITIVSEPYSVFYSGRTRRFVKGLCECGKIIEMIYSPHSKDYPKSCGCAKLFFKDRSKAEKIRSSYDSMMNRCYEPKHDSYKWYGAKGIKVCERWRNGFKYFYEDTESAWFLGAQIDRHPNKQGDYDILNWRWATATQQQREKSNSKITENDVLFIRSSNLSQKELSEMFRVRDNTISRIKNNKRWKL